MATRRWVQERVHDMMIEGLDSRIWWENSGEKYVAESLVQGVHATVSHSMRSMGCRRLDRLKEDCEQF